MIAYHDSLLGCSTPPVLETGSNKEKVEKVLWISGMPLR